MGNVLIKAIAFILVIVLGYVFKRLHFFKASDFDIISKIVLYITLPCAIITNFSKLNMQASLLFLVVIGVICNLIMIGVGYLAAFRKSNTEKVFNMVNFSGYNIGCFTMPYVQNFLGPVGVVATCLFDVGNSFLCMGGTYSLACIVGDSREKSAVRLFLKKMLSSAAIDIYVVMLIFSLLHLRMPAFVTTFAGMGSAANGFLSMLMIGVGFELSLKKGQLVQIIKTLVIRYGVAVLFSIIFYFYMPFSLEVRQILALISFAPFAALNIVFTEKCGGDLGLSSAINSISIICSTIIMTSLLLCMHIA